jgi:hypothetical protein
MNSSNRFEIETLARQHQAELEHQLRRSAQLRLPRRALTLAGAKVNFKAALVFAGAVALSLLVALGLSFSMVYAIANIR